MKQPNDKESRYCTRCTRALKACLCDYIQRVPNLAALHILQHPAEVGHPKGTAALLAASLTDVRIHVGEDFSDDEGLNALLADLSTLEAGYHLLSRWEGEPERFAPLMTLFTHLNRQWHDFAQGRRR